jgi:hypothetical protein
LPSLPAAGAAAQMLAGLPLLAFSMKSNVSYRIQVMSSWGMSAHQQQSARINGSIQAGEHLAALALHATCEHAGPRYT